MVVKNVNGQPSRKCLKCLIARYTGSNSLSNVLYRVSAVVIFLEKNEIGCHVSLIFCWNTAQTTVLEASFMRQGGASGLG